MKYRATGYVPNDKPLSLAWRGLQPSLMFNYNSPTREFRANIFGLCVKIGRARFSTPVHIVAHRMFEGVVVESGDAPCPHPGEAHSDICVQYYDEPYPVSKSMDDGTVTSVVVPGKPNNRWFCLMPGAKCELGEHVMLYMSVQKFPATVDGNDETPQASQHQRD